MRWLLIIISLISLISCQIEPKSFRYVNNGNGATRAMEEIDIWVDGNFVETDKVLIGDAIKQWNYALNGFIKLRLVSTKFDMEMEVIKRVQGGGGWLIMKVDSGHPMVMDEEGKVTLGWADKIGGGKIFLIRGRMKSEWITGIAMHEMGHLLGLRHGASYLMQGNFKWEEYRCIDEATIRLVTTRHHIPMGRLNYCIYEN